MATFTRDDYQRLAGRSFRITYQDDANGGAQAIDEDGQVRTFPYVTFGDMKVKLLRAEGDYILTIEAAEPLCLRLQQIMLDGSKPDDVVSHSPAKLILQSRVAAPFAPWLLFGLDKYLDHQ